jgi:hypothetical protein
LACDKNAPFSILRSLLDADVEKLSIGMPDKWGGESPREVLDLNYPGDINQ